LTKLLYVMTRQANKYGLICCLRQCFQPFNEMEPFVKFRLLAHHAVTQGFVVFQMGRNIIYLVTHEKTPIDTDVCA